VGIIMIVCSCRNISDRHFTSDEELRERIMQDDAECCTCQEIFLDDFLTIEEIND
jgi:hypothetical protein